MEAQRYPYDFDGVVTGASVNAGMHRVHHSVDTGEMGRNFGFHSPWWDRVLGTDRGQPAAGHHTTTNGLREHQADADQSLFWMIALPFCRR